MHRTIQHGDGIGLEKFQIILNDVLERGRPAFFIGIDDNLDVDPCRLARKVAVSKNRDAIYFTGSNELQLPRSERAYVMIVPIIAQKAFMLVIDPTVTREVVCICGEIWMPIMEKQTGRTWERKIGD